MFTDIRKEIAIRKTLRALARQRVATVLEPGGIWVIENAVKETPETEAAFNTCQMRGWIDAFATAVPKGQLAPDGTLPKGELFTDVGPIYRVTDSGWSVISRTNQWFLVGIVIATLTLVATIV